MNRLPLFVYLGTIVLLIGVIFYFLMDRQPPSDPDHPENVRYQALLDNVTDIKAATPTLDTTLELSEFFDAVNLPKGFHLIHDPTLGRQARVTGPVPMVRQLVLVGGAGILQPQVQAVFRSSVPVTIRLNLGAFTEDYIRISARSVPDSTLSALVPHFSTAGPLQHTLVHLRNLKGDGPVELATEVLQVYNVNRPDRLRGTTRFLRLHTDDGMDPIAATAFTNLTYEGSDVLHND